MNNDFFEELKISFVDEYEARFHEKPHHYVVEMVLKGRFRDENSVFENLDILSVEEREALLVALKDQ